MSAVKMAASLSTLHSAHSLQQTKETAKKSGGEWTTQQEEWLDEAVGQLSQKKERKK